MTDQSPAEAESRFMVQRCVDREGIVRVLGEFPCASMEQARQEAGRLMRLIPPAARAYHAVRIEHPPCRVECEWQWNAERGWHELPKKAEARP